MVMLDFIASIIGICGFVLASAQWIYTLYCKRTHYKVSIEKIEFAPLINCSRCIITFTIQNLSNSPLIITKMIAHDTQCCLSHQWVGDHYYPKFPESDIPHTERILSADFPINMVAHSGGMYKVVFEFHDKTFVPGNMIEVNIQTTNDSKNHLLYCPEINNNPKL